MKVTIAFLFLFACITTAFSQYQIGHVGLDYYDESRERFIPTHIYYPATTEGDETPVADGTFPYLVFGHGFSMNYSDYDYLWNYFVPRGYILVMPASESGFGPSHQDFGLDLAFLVDNFYDFSLDSETLFYNKVISECAVMGHSMGGGSSHLATSYTDQMSCIVTFAAAETDPSAIEAAANSVDIPVLVFYGEGDAVAPPDENQIPIYNASNSSCKTLINVLGGIHCYFAESQWACDFGETMSGSSADIDREEQHDIVCDLLGVYFDYELKGDVSAGNDYIDSLNNSQRIDVTRDCLVYYTIDVSANPSSGGVITGAGTYQSNETCTLTATENTGFEFINWTENGTEVSTASTYQFTVLADRNLIANFQDNVSINNNSSNQIEIYPNPTSDILYFDNLPVLAAYIQIYSIDGRLISEQKINNSICVDTFESGNYLIRIVDKQKNSLLFHRINIK
jgi:pimeloyl-ACP methyl ester carboxylesterase